MATASVCVTRSLVCFVSALLQRSDDAFERCATLHGLVAAEECAQPRIERLQGGGKFYSASHPACAPSLFSLQYTVTRGPCIVHARTQGKYLLKRNDALAGSGCPVTASVHLLHARLLGGCGA